jgi:iron complex outermembrane receptor protein
MRTVLSALLLSAAPAAALAQTAPPEDVYALGELQVTARTSTGEALGGSVIGGDVLQTYNRQTVDQALALIPGANASNTGGSRNERLIYVRGFDRFQTTISIDGVRVFLPADNRIDFARFLTADLSEIQVSKGYVSVLDGPGGLGGAINLVTVKPTAAFEAEAQGSVFFDRDVDKSGYMLSARLGGKTGAFYWQVSGADMRRDYFPLSKKFKPTSLENGGERDHSNSDDWRINAKVGWQPNATDEYSLNYTRSEGQKNAPFSVKDTANTRFWSWPYWNIDSVAFLSRTRLTDALTLKTRIYRNSFDNLLSAFDSAAQNTQTLPRAFMSYYKDHATGGNVELDWAVDDRSALKGVFYVRRDVHKERQGGFTRTPATGNPSVNVPYAEPWQTNDEYTFSAAAEYSRALTDSIDLVLGGSYDWTDLKTANDVNVLVTGTTVANSVIGFLPVNYPLRNNQAFNGQGALTWKVDDNTRAHASISARTRFPTVFERFSARMGTAIPNPDVREERAINYEIGGETRVGSNLHLTGAVFYSDLKDALIQIQVNVPGFGNINQTKNAAKGRYYGFEASAEWRLSDSLDFGGNLTYLHRKFTNPDPTAVGFRPQGVPTWKAFAYANWRPVPRLTLRPNLELTDDRWTVTTVAPLVYYRTGACFLANVSADYDVTDKIRFTVAVQNLGDQDYQLTDGFPEAGRTFYASIRARF